MGSTASVQAVQDASSWFAWKIEPIADTADCASRRVGAKTPVAPPPDDIAVVVVCPVVLPAALIADLVRAPSSEGRDPAARARVRPALRPGTPFPLYRVELEPRPPLCEQF